MVQSHPIVIAGRDSRFEYDLNREPDNAIYGDAWGKKLWKNPLTEKERKLSLKKHKTFFRVLHALIGQIEKNFGKAIVFDMHSFNLKRWDREVPTWNLGTVNIDNERFGTLATSWCQKLGEMDLPHGINSTSKINDTDFATEIVKSVERKVHYKNLYSNYLYNTSLATLKISKNTFR